VALAQQLVERFDIELPPYESTGDRWLSSIDAADLPGIGRAGTDYFPPTRRSLAELITTARVFGGSTEVLIQSDLAGPPLRDDDGSLYFFRIIATDETRAPESVDEVRDQLVDDLKRLKHYESLKNWVEGMENEAERKGLLSIALANDTEVGREVSVALYNPNQMRLQTATGQRLDPVATPLPVIGTHEPTVKAIVDYARSVPQDTPWKDLSTEQRIDSIAVDDRLAVIVYRLMDKDPFTEEMYTTMVNAGQLQQILLNDELDPTEAVTEEFGFETLAQRHNLEIVTPDNADDTEQVDDAEAEAVANAG
jgi:hypothetical protein